MEWFNIRDKQPKEGEVIIHLDRPYKNFYKSDFKDHYCIGMRQYVFYGESWEDFRQACKKLDCDLPDYWWMYAKDFIFPKQPERLNPEARFNYRNSGSDSLNSVETQRGKVEVPSPLNNYNYEILSGYSSLYTYSLSGDTIDKSKK